MWMDTATHLYMRNLESGFAAGTVKVSPAERIKRGLRLCWICFRNSLQDTCASRMGNSGTKNIPLVWRTKKLIQKDQEEVERILAKHGWPDPNEFLTFLDEDFCNPSRKYWMQNKDYTGTQHGRFPEGGRKVMIGSPGIAQGVV